MRGVSAAVERTRSRWTHRHHALPDFLVLGAQKAGTTSLFIHLLKSPKVLGPTAKELHFFSEGKHPRRYRDLGLGWYRSQFPLRSELDAAGAITGEATPRYLFEPDALRRIHRHLPRSRWIVVLRDPVERALSNYAMVVAKQDTSDLLPMLIRNERAAIDAGDPNAILCVGPLQFGILGRGFYTRQLREVQRLRPTQPTLVLFSENLYADDPASFALLHDFLGLPTPTTLRFPHRYRGDREGIPDDEASRAMLAEILHPANAGLAELLQSPAFLTVDPAGWPDWVSRLPTCTA